MGEGVARMQCETGDEGHLTRKKLYYWFRLKLIDNNSITNIFCDKLYWLQVQTYFVNSIRKSFKLFNAQIDWNHIYGVCVFVYAYHLECRVALTSPATVTVWVTLGGLMFIFTPQTQKVCATATNGRCKPSSNLISLG